jgi:hypothetical protein
MHAARPLDQVRGIPNAKKGKGKLLDFYFIEGI